MAQEEVPSTPIDAPVSTEAAPEGTTVEATEVVTEPATEPTTPTESTFFDAEALPDELKGRYGEMQSSYTRKMQELGTQRKAVESTQALVDAYQRDPIGTLQQLAAQSGYQVVQPGQPQQTQAQEPAEWQPESWQEVESTIMEKAKASVMQEMAPQIAQLRDQRAANVESDLDKIDPLWRNYESQMTDLVSQHPTLASNVNLLYDMAVPKEVREAKATQAALAKLRNIQGNASVDASTTQPKTIPATGLKERPTFAEAAAFALKNVGGA